MEQKVEMTDGMCTPVAGSYPPRREQMLQHPGPWLFAEFPLELSSLTVHPMRCAYFHFIVPIQEEEGVVLELAPGRPP